MYHRTIPKWSTEVNIFTIKYYIWQLYSSTIAISGQNRHFCSFQPQNIPWAPACPRLNLVSEDVFVNTLSDFIQFSLGQAGAHSEKWRNRRFGSGFYVIEWVWKLWWSKKMMFISVISACNSTTIYHIT